MPEKAQMLRFFSLFVCTQVVNCKFEKNFDHKTSVDLLLLKAK